MAQTDGQVQVGAGGVATGAILLVDDDPLVRKLARRILERSGHTVHEASNAGDAITFGVSHSGAIDLMITDVIMPGMRGTDLARHMAAARPSMRVLYVSGYGDDSITRDGETGARRSFLQKPFTPGTLAAKVREMLAAARAA